MPKERALEEALIAAVRPGIKPRDLLKEVQKVHPKASKKRSDGQHSLR
jgi:hypothetical protein